MNQLSVLTQLSELLTRKREQMERLLSEIAELDGLMVVAEKDQAAFREATICAERLNNGSVKTAQVKPESVATSKPSHGTMISAIVSVINGCELTLQEIRERSGARSVPSCLQYLEKTGRVTVNRSVKPFRYSAAPRRNE